MVSLGRASRKKVFCALFAALTVGFASAASGQSEAPWYAERLRRLGFEVFREPRALRDFSLSSLEGETTKLSSLGGKPILLNFWATWCSPCRSEMPSIQRLWDATKASGLTVMALSVIEKEATVRSYIAKENLSFPVYLDIGGKVSLQFDASSIPTTYVLNKEGMAIARIVGAMKYDSPEALSLFSELASR